MSTQLIEAARLALEALEYASTGNRRPEIIEPAITALRAALTDSELERKAENARELGLNYESNDLTIAYMSGFHDGKKKAKLEQPAQDDAKETFDQPVAWQWLDTGNFRKNLPSTAERSAWRPLYTQPVPTSDTSHKPVAETVKQRHEQPCPYVVSTREGTHHCSLSHREPLSDEQIGDLAALFYPKWRGHEGFARAIEAAHGIGEKK